MAYLKPQTPIQLNENYIYPLTTADQVITTTGERLNSLFKKTIKETATLQVANWSDTKPYTQTITLNYSVDDYNVDANVAYGDEDNAALHAAAGCISYIKKNHKEITFYCLKSKPEIDIPIEITGTCRNTIADITIEEGIKLNFDIVAYATEEELLADTPAENTIGVVTDVPITGYHFSATEPENMNDGEVWIETGDDSSVAFDIVEGAKMYPLYVKQYVDGAWVNKTAMSYQKGEWISIEKTLFPPIDGWSTTKISSSQPIGTGTFDVGVFVGKITATGQGIGITKQAIDFTNIRCVDVYFSESGFNQDSGDGGGVIALVTDNKYLIDGNEILSKWASDAECTEGVMRIDVSGVTGTHRFIVGIISWTSATGSITVHKIVEVA